MNKKERRQKQFYKLKKRLQNFKYKLEDLLEHNLYVFKTTGKPCSCYICSGKKYSRKQKHKNNERE